VSNQPFLVGFRSVKDLVTAHVASETLASLVRFAWFLWLIFDGNWEEFVPAGILIKRVKMANPLHFQALVDKASFCLH
jgi:hypothetical protein